MKIDVDHLKKRMQEEKMSRTDFCRASGFSPSGLSRILSGERAGSFEVLEGIIRAFPRDDCREFLLMESDLSLLHKAKF